MPTLFFYYFFFFMLAVSGSTRIERKLIFAPEMSIQRLRRCRARASEMQRSLPEEEKDAYVEGIS